MWDVFQSDPHQLATVLAIGVITAGMVVAGGIKAWRKVETHKRETELKLEMVNRGMSASDIERVLAAKSASSKDDA